MAGKKDKHNADIPAIVGGTPARDTMLPYATQWIDDDDIEAVVEVLRSLYLTTGPKVKEFEEGFAEYVGARYAVAVSNGTAALHAAVFAAGIGPGDEVITTPITFAASANCVLYQGGTPVFADIDPQTYNIDPNEIRKKITPKTKAIIPVHFAGQPCDMDEIHEVAREHRLIVIEDAAHALGAEYKGRKIGGLSDMTTFSFHPVKHITTGEGGMITTNDPALYEKLLLFRSHGITRDRGRMEKDEGLWYYEMQELGYNYRMTDFQAALGISQLGKCDKFIELRRKYVEMYNRAFEGVEGVIVPYENEDLLSAWHLYVIRLRRELLTAGRREVFEALRAENIGVNVHYIPVYMLPYYQRRGYSTGLCPQAERSYEGMITLPLFPRMSPQDVRDVVEAVGRVVAWYGARFEN